MSANAGNRFDAALRQIADRTVIGLLILLGSVPLVAAPASLAAGVSALRQGRLIDSIRQYWRVYRQHLGRSVLAGAVAVLLALSATCSVLIVGPHAEGLGRGLVVAAALVSALSSGFVVTYAAAALDLTGRAAPHVVGLLLLRSPRSGCNAVVLQLLTAISLCTVPVLALPLAGAVAHTTGRIAADVQSQVSRSA